MTPRKNNWRICKNNFWKTLTAPANMAGDVDLMACCGWLITLPLTLTVGVLIKTTIDIKSRHELSEADIKNIKDIIPTLDDEKFNLFVTNIIEKYRESISGINLAVKSRESFSLIRTLLDTNSEYTAKIARLRYEEIRRVKEEKLAAFKEINDKGNQYTISDCKLTDMELQTVSETVALKSIPFFAENRRTQTDAIIQYLDNALNAGKKMEHIINDQIDVANATISQLR